MNRVAELDLFAEFVRDRGASLRRTAYLFTRDWYRADDLVQTALVRTFERRHRIRDPKALESYTRKVIATSFLSERRLKSATEVSVAEAPDGAGSTVSDGSAAVADNMAVWSALGALSDMQRAVLVLRYYGDASEAEIADVLGCSTGSVKTHASRGLAIEARDSSGKKISQGAVSNADGLPYARVDPGDLVVMHGSWDFFCGSAKGPLTATVMNYSADGTVQAGWPLAGTIPVPGRIAECADTGGGGPSLSAVSVGRPGSFPTLDSEIQVPAAVPSGGDLGATITLTNRTQTPVFLGNCPDLRTATPEDPGNGAGGSPTDVFRIVCPADLTLQPDESIRILLPLEAPVVAKTTTRTLYWGWYRTGDLDYRSASAVAGYAVTVPSAATQTARDTPATRLSATSITSPSIGVPQGVTTTTPSKGLPLCTATDVRISIAPGLTTPSINGLTRVTLLVTHRNNDATAMPCLINRDNFQADLRGPNGQQLATNTPPDPRFPDNQGALVLRPLDTVIITGYWAVDCGEGSGPVSVSASIVTGSGTEANVILPVEGTLKFSTCDSTNSAQVARSSLVTRTASGTDIDTLEGTLHLPKTATPGRPFTASLTLSNPSTVPVNLASCPDLVIGLDTPKAVDIRFLRAACPNGLDVGALGSVEITFTLTAQAAGSYDVGLSWFEGGPKVAPDEVLVVKQ